MSELVKRQQAYSNISLIESTNTQSPGPLTDHLGKYIKMEGHHLVGINFDKRDIVIKMKHLIKNGFH